MIIRFINPFEYGSFRQWDLIIIDEYGSFVFRASVQFNNTDTDDTIMAFGESVFYNQGYLSYNEIIIDKPDHWGN
jgi:hypothetical protein